MFVFLEDVTKCRAMCEHSWWVWFNHNKTLESFGWISSWRSGYCCYLELSPISESTWNYCYKVCFGLLQSLSPNIPSVSTDEVLFEHSLSIKAFVPFALAVYLCSLCIKVIKRKAAAVRACCLTSPGIFLKNSFYKPDTLKCVFLWFYQNPFISTCFHIVSKFSSYHLNLAWAVILISHCEHQVCSRAARNWIFILYLICQYFTTHLADNRYWWLCKCFPHS